MKFNDSSTSDNIRNVPVLNNTTREQGNKERNHFHSIQVLVSTRKYKKLKVQKFNDRYLTGGNRTSVCAPQHYKKRGTKEKTFTVPDY